MLHVMLHGFQTAEQNCRATQPSRQEDKVMKAHLQKIPKLPIKGNSRGLVSPVFLQFCKLQPHLLQLRSVPPLWVPTPRNRRLLTGLDTLNPVIYASSLSGE